MQSESNMPKEEKISLKNVFQGFKQWLVFIIDKRKTIVYGTLITLVLPLSYNYLKSPLYYANTSFVLENDALFFLFLKQYPHCKECYTWCLRSAKNDL